MHLWFCQGQLVLFLGYSLGGILDKNLKQNSEVSFVIGLNFTVSFKNEEKYNKMLWFES